MSANIELEGKTTTKPGVDIRPYRTVWEAMNTHSTVAACAVRDRPAMAEAVDQVLMGVVRYAWVHGMDPADVHAAIEYVDGAILVRLT
ncbi:MAG: hypothetical protein NVSMB19_18550 [Vulcanimicrobiaceae bacterium]